MINSALIAFAVVMLSWIAFVVVFATQGKSSSSAPQKREKASIFGIVLQGTAYGIVWMVRRKFFTPIVLMNGTSEVALAIFTSVLVIASVWFCGAAVRALGKQWSLQARVVAGHKLITRGPYRLVRNPIYTGMLGMLIATGLAVSHWIGLAVALIVFSLGTAIRISSEEKLLRETFGTEWDDYARQVPAVIPFLI